MPAADEGIAERDRGGRDALLEVDSSGTALGSLDEGNEQGRRVTEVSVTITDGNLHN